MKKYQVLGLAVMATFALASASMRDILYRY
jgi:hypothetical protein